MNIPMEFLSLDSTGTDSGAGAKASRASPGKDKGQFNKLLEKELGRHDQKMLNQQKVPKNVTENSGSVRKADSTAAEKTIFREEGYYRRVEPYKEEVAGPDAEIQDDETVLAAGAENLITGLMSQQQEQQVVSILEGEESVNLARQDLSPPIRAENTEGQVPPEQTEQKTQQPVTNESKTFATVIQERVNEPPGDNSNRIIVNQDSQPLQAQTQTQEVHAENPGKTEIKSTVSENRDDVTDTTKTEVTGDVTARRPQAESDTGKEKQSDESNKEKGNPRPLEYKNETAQKPGQTANAEKEDEKAQLISNNDIKSAINKAKGFKTEKDDTAKTDARTDIKTEAKTEVKTEVKSDVKSDTKTDAGTNDKAQDSKQAQPVATETFETPLPFEQGFKAIQFKASEQLVRAAYQQPVKPENLFQELVSKVETMTNETKSTMTIQLNPEHLGKVALEVALDASGVHVKIKAEDNNIRNMINTQLTALIETLENKGHAVSEVEVVFAGANFDSDFSQRDNSKQESTNSGKAVKHATDTKGTIEYYTTLTGLMDYYLDAGVSTVEYRA